MKNFIMKKVFIFNTFKSISFRTLNFKRTYASSLYVPGNVAKYTFSLLKPYIDFEERLVNLQKLQNDLKLRGLDVDVTELRKSWIFFQSVKSSKDVLEDKAFKLTKQIENIHDDPTLVSEPEKEINLLKTQRKLIHEDLKTLKDSFWNLEEILMPQLLKLPNDIDEKTPPDTTLLLKSIQEPLKLPENKKQHHLDIGLNLGLVEYKNPIQYYLCNEAVIFELGILSLAGRILNDKKFIRITGPDFTRSILVEGVGLDHENPMDSFILKSTDKLEGDFLINRLHLVGSASLPAQLALYTKQFVVEKDKFPIKVFTAGRQYQPHPFTLSTQGLFSVCQASAIQAMIHVAEKGSEQYHAEFDNLVEATSNIYNEIGCHYRIVMKPAKELSSMETMRVSFEMWSAYLDEYVEVGHVSACGDYITKRLLITRSKNRTFLSTITGTLISVPKVLACLLEQNPETFQVPEKVADCAF